MIEVENLKKTYAGFPAVKGVSFSVQPGEVVGFLGPNGAGKTTTLRILTGYMPATEGTTRVAGFDVTRNSRDVRRRVGYLPEDVPLYRDLTVRAFLTYMAGLKEIPAASMRAEVERVMEITGLAPVIDRLVGQCSKGYRQRTGLAMALLGDPPVLMLDEPTSGLDPNQVVEVRELIRRLSGEKTVLLSSHILSEVGQICSRVLIIHQGELVAAGTPEALGREFATRARLRVRTGAVVPESFWNGLDGVRCVRADGPRVLLDVAAPDADAPRVARALLDAGYDLVELHHETVDLESVFRTVTGNAGATADA